MSIRTTLHYKCYFINIHKEDYGIHKGKFFFNRDGKLYGKEDGGIKACYSDALDSLKARYNKEQKENNG